MRMTFALAALFAATAITPALAQDMGRGERGDRGARSEQRGGERAERPQGGWQRGQQAAPAPAPQPQPQVQAAAPAQPQAQQGERRWNGNRGMNNGLGAQPNWGRERQEGARNWRRDDAPGSQLGGSAAAAPPAVTDRGQRRWDGNQANRNGQFDAPRNTAGRNDNWRNDGNRNNGQNWQGRNDGRNDAWRNQQRNDGNRFGNNGYRPDNRNWNGNSGWNGNRAWSRDWRRDQQYDWQRYRYSNRNLFRGNPYYAPRGWGYGYQRFSIGITLNSLLFDQQYWIDDPYDYRLPPAYGPYRWVRYYDDVLLVDLRSGQVVDVIHDFFW